MDIISALTKTVSISSLNKGKAGQIFDDVKKTGAKVVIKNNEPECVLISPKDYLELLQELEDARLLISAIERLKNTDKSKSISQEEIMNKYNITEDDLNNIEEVEFE